MHVVSLIFYFVALSVLAFFGLHKYLLLLLVHRYGSRPLPPASPPTQWPAVTVQLPIYNERHVIKRLLRAVTALDYPADRLHIQVLDDSTDCTVRLAGRLVQRLRGRGVNIEHIHRRDRSGYKAGALANGLLHSTAEFIAVFDADFVPNQKFLKQTIPYVRLPGIGMVQTRWGHLNRTYSLLTRLQALFLDGHFLIEHVARSRTGRFFNFNGTAGVWKREAIVDAGGWRHDTLTEDLDLSYRAQLAGWRFLYLRDVVCPAELPVDMSAYRTQQHRWAKGSVQTALKLLPRIWRSPVPFRVRLEASVHLTSNFAYLLMFIQAVMLIPMLLYQFQHHLRWPVTVYLTVFLSATVSVVCYYGYAIRAINQRLWPQVLFLPVLMALGIGLSVNNGWAVLEGLRGRESEFVRTPKNNATSRTKRRLRHAYRSPWSFLTILEFIMVCYYAAGLTGFLVRRVFLSVPFFLLFFVGFLFISTASMSERIRRNSKPA